MPYISKNLRKKFTANFDSFPEVKTPGELNYVFTMLALQYIRQKENYQRYNDIIGALEGCKLEFYRKCVAMYEEVKIAENGQL